MSGDTIGRAVILNVAGSPIAAGRTKSLTINNTVINVTGDDDAGLQALLSTPGEKSVEITIDGMHAAADEVLVTLALNTDISAALEWTFGSGSYKLSGDFKMTSYSQGAPYNDAVTFSASFSSNGAVVKAAVV
jgi:predicted secreted protein